jgi:hypothetical protein
MFRISFNTALMICADELRAVTLVSSGRPTRSRAAPGRTTGPKHQWLDSVHRCIVGSRSDGHILAVRESPTHLSTVRSVACASPREQRGAANPRGIHYPRTLR